MWLFYAIGSAFFAGVTSILAKCGIRKTDSTVATAVRTVVVLIFSWIMVFVSGSFAEISSISGYTSTVLTIILALIFLQEGISLPKAGAVIVIAAGIFLMIEKKDVEETKKSGKGGWLIYSAGSAFFASLTAILGKIGISGVESNLGTAIRTCVVLIMAWGMVFVTGKQKEAARIGKKEMAFICLSGVATGASWLCYYRALQEGPASIVAPVDKLSVLVTVAFSYFVFGEKLGRKEAAGLVLLTAGTVAMALL